jgi:hypothetical protein
MKKKILLPVIGELSLTHYEIRFNFLRPKVKTIL